MNSGDTPELSRTFGEPPKSWKTRSSTSGGLSDTGRTTRVVVVPVAANADSVDKACPNAPPPATSGVVGSTELYGVTAVFGSVVAVGGAPGPMNTNGEDVFAVVGT